MSEMTWQDAQTKAQKEQAANNLAKAENQEQEKINADLIRFPVPIKKGIAIKWITPHEAQDLINKGADVPFGVKYIVKKALKTLEVSDK